MRLPPAAWYGPHGHMTLQAKAAGSGGEQILSVCRSSFKLQAQKTVNGKRGFRGAGRFYFANKLKLSGQGRFRCRAIAIPSRCGTGYRERHSATGLRVVVKRVIPTQGG